MARGPHARSVSGRRSSSSNARILSPKASCAIQLSPTSLLRVRKRVDDGDSRTLRVQFVPASIESLSRRRLGGATRGRRKLVARRKELADGTEAPATRAPRTCREHQGPLPHKGAPGDPREWHQCPSHQNLCELRRKSASGIQQVSQRCGLHRSHQALAHI
jgi:hypothetical protein